LNLFWIIFLCKIVYFNNLIELDFFEYFLKLQKTIFSLRGDQIFGKLDMQKSFYFAKELGLPVPFKFRWDKLGPFSYELSNVLEIARRRGFLVYNGTYKYNEHRFENVENFEDISDEVYSFFDDLIDAIEENNFDPVYFIECLASLQFLYRYSGLSTKKSTFDRLRILKQDRINNLEPLMEPSWNFLVKHNLVSKR